MDPRVSDSLKDLKGAVLKKKDWLTLVDSREQAGVVLEVLRRDLVPRGVTSQWDESTKQMRTTEVQSYDVRVHVTAGDFTSDVVGSCSSEYILGGWKCAAGDAASQVEKFVQKNYDRLVSHTMQSAPAVASGSSPSTAGAAPHGETVEGEVLTNDLVISMAGAGLSDAVIVQKIKTSRSRFNMDTKNLLALKKAGVSDKVIAAMMEAPSR